jgi:hypothetical protein
MRLLAPGSMALYYYSTLLSIPGEKQYMEDMEGVPYGLTTTQMAKVMNEMRETSKSSYVVCRDYDNFNQCHKHTDMIRWYEGIRDAITGYASNIFVDAVNNLIECMRTVAILDGDKRYEWEYGLMSGWRHTMLFNTTFNKVYADVACEIMTREIGTKRLRGQYMGDDSFELYDSAIGGPWVQGLLDACGKVGNPAKQFFASTVGAGFEFLRIFYANGLTLGSSVRACASFVISDTQTPQPVGGSEMTTGVISVLNTLYRRTATFALSESDILNIAGYWLRTEQDELENKYIDGAVAFVSKKVGGLGCVHPVVCPDRIIARIKSVRIRDTRYHGAKILTNKVYSKIQTICPRLDLREYAHVFAKDTLSTATSMKTQLDVVVNKRQTQFVLRGRKQNGLIACAERELSTSNRFIALTDEVNVADASNLMLSEEVGNSREVLSSVPIVANLRVKPRHERGDTINRHKYRHSSTGMYLRNVDNGDNDHVLVSKQKQIHKSIVLKYAGISKINPHFIAALNIKSGRVPIHDRDEQCIEAAVSSFFGGSRLTATAYMHDNGVPTITVHNRRDVVLQRGLKLVFENKQKVQRENWLTQYIPGEMAHILTSMNRYSSNSLYKTYYNQLTIGNLLIALGMRY